jgi:hypothetical protein
LDRPGIGRRSDRRPSMAIGMTLSWSAPSPAGRPERTVRPPHIGGVEHPCIIHQNSVPGRV